MTADIPARTDRDIEADLATRVSVANLGNVRAARNMASALRDEALLLLARAQKAEANYADLYSRIGDLQASEADLVAAPLRAQRDRAELAREKAEAKAAMYRERFGNQMLAGQEICDENDRLRAELAAERAKVQAVEALCDEQDAETARVSGGRQHPLWTVKIRAALASAATPEPSVAPEVCAKPMHKNCGCVRPKGHVGHCNCTYRSAPEGEQP